MADPKKILELAVLQAAEHLTSPEVLQQLADRITAGEEAPLVVGPVVISTLRGIKESAKQSGGDIPPKLLAEAAKEVCYEVFAALAQLGVVDQNDIGQLCKMAIVAGLHINYNGAQQPMTGQQPQQPQQPGVMQNAPAQ